MGFEVDNADGGCGSGPGCGDGGVACDHRPGECCGGREGGWILGSDDAAVVECGHDEEGGRGEVLGQVGGGCGDRMEMTIRRKLGWVIQVA